MLPSVPVLSGKTDYVQRKVRTLPPPPETPMTCPRTQNLAVLIESDFMACRFVCVSFGSTTTCLPRWTACSASLPTPPPKTPRSAASNPSSGRPFSIAISS